MFAKYSSNDMWQVDILDVSEYSSMNDGYKYLLCVIDVFSRRAFVKAAKNRRDITERMNEMLSDKQPIVLQTCNRKEFTSDSFKAILNQHNVRHSIVSMNESKSKQAYVERFKRTLLSKLPQRYIINTLDEIVSDYNNTKHHSLNDTPNNRYEQNPNRGVITVTDYTDIQRKRRKTKHPNERKRKRKYITANDDVKNR
jgi:transposase InsO family protein